MIIKWLFNNRFGNRCSLGLADNPMPVNTIEQRSDGQHQVCRHENPTNVQMTRIFS